MSNQLPALDSSVFDPPPEAVQFYVDALKLLKDNDFQFLLSGTYALSCYTGITRRPRISTSSASPRTRQDPELLPGAGLPDRGRGRALDRQGLERRELL
jgi:hypothetical protein